MHYVLWRVDRLAVAVHGFCRRELVAQSVTNPNTPSNPSGRKTSSRQRLDHKNHGEYGLLPVDIPISREIAKTYARTRLDGVMAIRMC